MHSLKVLVRARRSLRKLGSSPHQRSLSAQPHYASLDDVQDQVLVDGRASSRTAILNRPSALNSLTTSMVARLKRLYESWEDNPNVGFVSMKGSGKAFCSGGDVITLYIISHWRSDGNIEECKTFFDTLYKFIYVQGTYLKPHLAILDGVTMASGAGISLPGMFRLATDKTDHCRSDVRLSPSPRSVARAVALATVCRGMAEDQDCFSLVSLSPGVCLCDGFSHPEVQIGFHPDAGASFHLSRLPGYLGEYLALTGDKLNGVEMVACRLATHYSLNARLALIEERLGRLTTDDPSVIETSLSQYGDLVYPDRRSIIHKIDVIDKCFSHDTVEEIIHALEIEAADSYGEWCAMTLKKLREASPLSLKVTLRSIREGRFQSLDQCLTREYRISLRGISGEVSKDFCEGVRARLVDKDFAPKWDPPSLEEATKEMVDFYVSPLISEPELELPTASREPSV
ncbi:hypothetical protein NL676_034260 [Syzygium grande]|nr:hypothetical protein NL676_034260 [Syzygium grande]